MVDIQMIKKEIVERLKPLELERIVLFGSYANGTATEESDIDLYVVTRDEFIPQSWREKNKIYKNVSRAIRDIREVVSVDLLVHTKKMCEYFQEINRPFASEIQKGEVLWQR